MKAAPEVFRLAGHPLRWRLLTELGRSDRQVRELTEAVGKPQNLVSYHLGLLRAAGIVSARRSSADGRDTYYSLDLGRWRDGLTRASKALHPGLVFSDNVGLSGSGGGGRPAAVLFLCTGNSSRSQMAEALLRELARDEVEVCSAGSHPKPVHTNAIRAMRERGIDMSGAESKPLSRFERQRFDYVITLCDRVREVCPDFPDSPELIHWSIADPALAGDNDDESYAAFQRTAAEIEARIRFLLDVINDKTTQWEVDP